MVPAESAWTLPDIDTWDTILKAYPNNYFGLNEALTAVGGQVFEAGNYWTSVVAPSSSPSISIGSKYYYVYLNAGTSTTEAYDLDANFRTRASLAF